jgi:hypothetical protein
MSAMTAETPTQPGSLERMRDRAISDYLAVSRNAHVYATTTDYLAAEERAWERVQASIRRSQRVEDSALV